MQETRTTNAVGSGEIPPPPKIQKWRQWVFSSHTGKNLVAMILRLQGADRICMKFDGRLWANKHSPFSMACSTVTLGLL